MKERITSLAVFSILFSTSILHGVEKRGDGSIPIISYAKLPIYPTNARIANINGTVMLKLSTDGGSISKIIPLEGPPMLVNAATEMISEWRFLQHDPVEFTVTIQYILTTTPYRCSDVVVFDLGKKIVIKGFRTKS